MPESRQCKDCPPESKRPAPKPGPRCITHDRVARKRRSELGHAARILAKYRITKDQYILLYEHQGGRCFICQRATGATRRLSVDHDHARAKTVCGHDPDTGCPSCIRGLVCRPCNDLLGHLRDDPNAFMRAVAYLLDPPARKVLS